MSAVAENDVQVELHCGDIDEAQRYFAEGGLRIDTVFPADAPRVVDMSTSGLRLRLTGDAQAATSAPGLVVTRLSDDGFGTGRAGMEYRDLVPGRFGGRFIASHIRIRKGGPVPDYVHHHDIEFQMIFCVNGWVRVVYEDQGEPMLMKAGDCFLQPPHIRHRVLECSDEMEVVEIACPAEHETSVDHDMTLPTGELLPDREFGGQTFVFHRAERASWLLSDIPGMQYRNTGIAAATGGVASAVVLRANGPCGDIPLRHSAEFRFCFFLNGSAMLTNGDDLQLTRGDAIAVPPDYDCSLEELSDDIEILEVIVPRS
jgi:quercetin dioxygenase-like cupin family protein